MIIAKEKKQENIIEYLLYMFQIEDLIRAYNLDPDQIEKKVLVEYDQEEDVLSEIKEWYRNHIHMMIQEKKQKTGHLIYIENLISDLEDFHIYLLKKVNNKEYLKLYQQALPAIQDLKSKLDDHGVQDIHACLNGLYGYLLLKMQKKEISELTKEAIDSISQMLAYLSEKQKMVDAGELEL